MGALVNIYYFYSLKRKEITKKYPFSEKELKLKHWFAHSSIWIIYILYIPIKKIIKPYRKMMTSLYNDCGQGDIINEYKIK